MPVPTLLGASVTPIIRDLGILVILFPVLNILTKALKGETVCSGAQLKGAVRHDWEDKTAGA